MEQYHSNKINRWVGDFNYVLRIEKFTIIYNNVCKIALVKQKKSKRESWVKQKEAVRRLFGFKKNNINEEDNIKHQDQTNIILMIQKTFLYP